MNVSVEQVGQGGSTGAGAPPASGRHRLLRVWMVDDNAPLRESFAQLLNGKPGLRVSRQFGSISPLLAALAEERPPDIILLDLNIGHENGLSAIRPAKKLAPAVKVLMLTTFNNTYAEVEAFRAGASGFLLKIYEPDEIVELIFEAYRHPANPRLFPNLANARSQTNSTDAKPTAGSTENARPGFFSTLRQLYRPGRRNRPSEAAGGA